MQLEIIVTTACNLACDYCYVRGLEEQDTSLEAVRRCLALPDFDGRISLFGGEPLLDFARLRGMVDFIRAVRPDATFAITTNGTLIDNDIAAWCAEEMDAVCVSIDGCAETHDVHRVDPRGQGSAEKAWRGLERLVSAAAPVEVATTLNPDTAPRLADSVVALVDAGIRRVNHNFNARAVWPAEALSVLAAQYRELEVHYERWMHDLPAMEFVPFDNRIKSHVSEGATVCECAVQDSVLVMPDGRLVPCDAFVVDVDRWCIGTVEEGLDEARRNPCLERAPARQDGRCAECPIATRCFRTCRCTNLLGSGSPHIVPDAYSEYMRLLTASADRVAARLYAEGSTNFLSRFYGAIAEGAT